MVSIGFDRLRCAACFARFPQVAMLEPHITKCAERMRLLHQPERQVRLRSHEIGNEPTPWTDSRRRPAVGASSAGPGRALINGSVQLAADVWNPLTCGPARNCEERRRSATSGHSEYMRKETRLMKPLLLRFANRQAQALQVKLPILRDAPVFGARN
jgi:hypothetical protein